MAISGSSVTPAAAAAATPAVTGDLVNVAVGYPAAARWPGPVDPGTYDDAGPQYLIEGPPGGDWILDDWTAEVPSSAPGGGIQDTSWTSGTDGPIADWDSSAGQPFAPSGAVDPVLHEQDTGAVYAAQHVTPAYIGSLVRHTITTQTYNREYDFDPVTGEYVPGANGRVNFDQAQPWDPAPGDGGGYAPWDPGYAERPVQLNVAYQATPVTSLPTGQGVAGALPDRAPFNAYPALAYDAPADPVVGQPAAPSPITGGWLL